MFTSIFGIWASELPPGPGERLKRPGLIGLNVFNEFIQIHALFPPKTVKQSISFTWNSLYKCNNMEMVAHLQVEEVRLSSVKFCRMQVLGDKVHIYHPVSI